jgi:hypothetical protein
MAAGQLFGLARRARMGRGKRRCTARQRRPGGWRRLEREVGDDPGDVPNGSVQPNGPAWQLGWLSVFGPKSRI